MPWVPAHAIQPGHGKTLVAASSLGPGERARSGGPCSAWRRPPPHLASVALIAAGPLGSPAPTRLGEFHLTLARLDRVRSSPPIGLWRLGPAPRPASAEHDPRDRTRTGRIGSSEFDPARAWPAGVVPCWDAVALVVIVAAAIDRLAPRPGRSWLAFSLGMAQRPGPRSAFLASRFRASIDRFDPLKRCERTLGLLAGLILVGLGFSMMAR